MCGSLAIARSLRSGVGALVLVAVLLAGHRAAFAQCVGDCGDDGMVSIGDLILGVNISLGLQPPTACPAFQDAEGKVSIAQLIRGVNNSLEGCPMTPGPTATETATEVSPTSTATATDTLTPSSDSTATSTAAVSATATSTALASATATSTTAASPNATQAGTATATASVTTTHTPGPSPTPSQTLSPSVTATSTPPATATFTDTATPSTPASGTFTATPTVTATPTETEFPIGVFAGGKLPIVSAGFGAIQSIVAGLLAQLTNQGPIALTAGVVMPSVDPCPLMGTTSQECTEMGSGDDKTIHLVISADGCTVPGPFNGTEEFSGVITIDADPSSSNSCGRPFHFKSGTVHIEGPPPGDGPTLPFLTDVRADGNQDARQIFANLDGTIALSIPTPAPTCLANGVTLTLGGELRTELVFGTEVQAILNDITAVMDQITFNAYCVPVDYRLKLTGPASFFINVPAPALTTQSGLIGDQGSFSVTFSNDFLVHQNATDNPAKVDMIGTMSSDCFGGDVDVLVISPIVVQADQVCPDEGIARVTSGAIMAELTYDQGGVTVDQDGNQDTVFCLAPELLLCPPM